MAPCGSAWASRPTPPELLHGLAGGLRLAGRAALDLALPPHCVCCGEPVVEPGQLCPDCFRLTGFITDPGCVRCGVPFSSAAQGGWDRLCPTCRDTPPAFDRARAALPVRGLARAARTPMLLDALVRARATVSLGDKSAPSGLRNSPALSPCVPRGRRGWSGAACC